MNLLSWFQRAPAPAPAARAPRHQVAANNSTPAQARPKSSNYYDALIESQDRSIVPAYALAIRLAIQGFNRERLASLGQWLYDNDGLCGLAVDTIANYSVPIIPQATTKDPGWNKDAQLYFGDWAQRADFSGRFTYDSLQRLACKLTDQHGDGFALMTGENGFPQIQLVETWQVSSRNLKDKALARDGVGVDAKGRVRGFYVEEIPDKEPVLISVNEMFHFFDPDRYSLYRGITPIRRGSNDSRDARDIKGFEKVATKINSALAAVLESDGPIEEDIWGNDSGDGDEGDGAKPDAAPPVEGATPQEKKLSLAELLGGDIPVLPHGQKLHAIDHNRPGERVIELLGYLGACFVSGLGMPPAFILDGKYTGPNQRSVNGKAQRKFNQRQVLFGAFAGWTWNRVIGDAIATGKLKSVDGWNRIEWQGPPQVSIDEGRDAQQWRDDVMSGLMTRANHYANRALGWQQQTDQNFVEDDYIFTRAAELSKKHNLPMETVLTRYGYTQAKAPPTEEAKADDEDDTEETPSPADKKKEEAKK